eukprot:12834403-Ditylum_brightwellii.AAC.1
MGSAKAFFAVAVVKVVSRSVAMFANSTFPACSGWYRELWTLLALCRNSVHALYILMLLCE